MKLLEGKTAIITGAARGIGEAIALKFAEHGANVAFTFVSDGSKDKAKALEEKLIALGVKAKSYQSNAGDFAACEIFVNNVLKEFGAVDICVNNAGISKVPTLVARLSTVAFEGNPALGASDLVLIFDSDRDGGLEFGTDALDQRKVLARAEKDPRLQGDEERCRVFRNFVQWSEALSVEGYSKILNGACRAYPIESRMPFPSLSYEFDRVPDSEASDANG